MNEAKYASTNKYPIVINGIFQPPVSRLIAAIVDKHCGANTNHAKSEYAVASDHCCAMMDDSAAPASSPAIEYTVPSALTSTSRAANPEISATLICQLKPIGANT